MYGGRDSDHGYLPSEFAASLAENNKQIEPMDVCTPGDLLVRTAKSDLSRWLHLLDLFVVNWESETVNRLLGCKLPEVNWIMEQIVGGPQSPYAVSMTLGWILYGPSSEVSDKLHYGGAEKYRGKVEAAKR